MADSGFTWEYLLFVVLFAVVVLYWLLFSSRVRAFFWERVVRLLLNTNENDYDIKIGGGNLDASSSASASSSSPSSSSAAAADFFSECC